ncbi:hypothetical protein QKW52_16090 [Bacillus sonorensis]|uniref:hypothetical protein n=1 Tax=Bacillus sonorensis TaxID=119858 RepID=UPI002A13D56F|nr:hypothetical protein [Bacillus sonorensis]
MPICQAKRLKMHLMNFRQLLYLAQDSLGTATNVTGDGALTMLIHRLTSKNGVGKEEDAPA